MGGNPLKSGSATIDGTGRAVVTLGPDVYGSRWNVDLMSVTTTGAAQTTCNVYRDSESDSNKVDNTRTGNNDTSDTNLDLRPPQRLVFVWSGGTPGAIATATCMGTLYTGRH